MKLFLYCFREFDEKKYFDVLCKEKGIDYDYTEAYPSLQNVHLAAGYDGVSFTPTKMDAGLLEAFHQAGVSCFLTRSIGYDHIDLKRAQELNLHVSNVSYPPEAVADYAIMLILMCLRKMPFIMEQSRVQNYTLKGKVGKSIGESTIGVVGTGMIGRTVIKYLSSFGCRILAYSPSAHKEVAELCEYVSFEKLLAESDVVTLHAPSTLETQHMFDKKAFEMMKTGGILINTARGNLIDTDALIEALLEGGVSAAALDVLEDEKNLYYIDRSGDCINNRQMAMLRSFPNVILTPHTAFYTETTVESMAQNTVNCLLDMAAGRENPLIIV
ncbi:NAD(P)-dependent oxidoreductase [Eubacteriaceae bacterium ES3]|nr:NAD(P)-dependent oxidoreductase [Eubacteriaceae bacterium ES3]